MKKLFKKIGIMLMVCALVITSFGSENIKIASAESDYTQLASELPLNGAWSDYYMTDDNTEQWYKINVPADGEVSFKIMAYMGYLQYGLYNSDLTVKVLDHYYFGGTETSPDTDSYYISLSAGTYYLKVEKYNDNGKFRLNFSYENYGTNDAGANSYDNPLDLGLGVMITGALTFTDKEDWYRVNIPTTGYYSIKVTTYSKYLDYHFYNQDMTKEISKEEYFYGTSTAPATKTFDVTLSAGTYYIKMNCGDKGKYFLSVNALSQANCTHDYSSETVSATYLSKGYRIYKCSKCGHTYAADYTDKLVLGQVNLYSASSSTKRKLYYYHYGVYDASGYQVRYSTDKKFKKSVKTSKHKLYGGYTIGKLKRHKKYYVQVRAYKKVGKKTVYGKWSAKKGVKIK